MASSRNRRKLVWARSTGSISFTTSPDAEVVDLLSQFRTMMGITANLPGTTIARIRMDTHVPNATQGVYPFYLGIRKVNLRDVAEAAADGAYALAVSPSAEPGADWMYWRALFPNHGADASTGLPNAITNEHDVRAMRRLDEPQETLGLFLAKQTSLAGATIHFGVSVLLSLP